MNFALNAAVVFAALFALDLAWARYTLALTEKRRVLSGCYASGIILLSGFATINYVGDPWMLLPAAAGAFAGTFVGTK